jgi:hypothetical protein
VKLEHLRQGRLSVEQYYLQVDQFIQKAGGVTDAQIISILERNLNSALINKMYGLEEVPGMYMEWKVHSTNYNNIWRRRQELGSPAEVRRRTLTNATPRKENLGELMDVNSGRQHLKGTKCYSCGGMEHLAQNCQGQKEVQSLEEKENSKEDFPGGKL